MSQKKLINQISVTLWTNLGYIIIVRFEQTNIALSLHSGTGTRPHRRSSTADKKLPWWLWLLTSLLIFFFICLPCIICAVCFFGLGHFANKNGQQKKGRVLESGKSSKKSSKKLKTSIKSKKSTKSKSSKSTK